MSGDNRKPEMRSRGLTPTPAVAGQTHTWGALEAEILNPRPTPRADQNGDSVVKAVSDGDSRFLFAGDIGTSTESTILAEGMSVEADVLQVAHYGSRHSSSTDFLEAVGAEVAVICVGDNTYGHPTDEALERLRDAGAQVCRTDLHGTVVIVSDGQTIAYTCAGDCNYLTFLPLVVCQHVPRAPLTPPPMPGDNVVCEAIGNVQFCGSVSDGTPPKYSDVTVHCRYCDEETPTQRQDRRICEGLPEVFKPRKPGVTCSPSMNRSYVKIPVRLSAANLEWAIHRLNHNDRWLEVGLHFESSHRDKNAAALQQVRDYQVSIESILDEALLGEP